MGWDFSHRTKGMSNREIAEELFISPRTVTTSTPRPGRSPRTVDAPGRAYAACSTSTSRRCSTGTTDALTTPRGSFGQPCGRTTTTSRMPTRPSGRWAAPRARTPASPHWTACITLLPMSPRVEDGHEEAFARRSPRGALVALGSARARGLSGRSAVRYRRRRGHERERHGHERRRWGRYARWRGAARAACR